jgi:hypothetical protein
MTETGFRVYIPDPTHGEGDWSETGEKGPTAGASAEFRQSLEAEYKEEFQFTSIGTGAALASYFVELVSDPYRDAATAAAVFYTGKAIKEGLESWGWIYAQLSKFFRREPTFDRNGAAILAYQAITAELGHVPASYQLKGFANQNRLAYPDPSNLPDLGELTIIEPAPDRVQRAIVYVFQIVADGQEFRVEVDGHEVRFLQGCLS